MFILNFQHRKVVFLVSSGQNQISLLFPPLQKSFWLLLKKSSIVPLLEEILPMAMPIKITATS